MLSPVQMAPCLWEPAKKERVSTNGRTLGFRAFFCCFFMFFVFLALFRQEYQAGKVSSTAPLGFITGTSTGLPLLLPELPALGARTSCPSTVACSRVHQGGIDQVVLTGLPRSWPCDDRSRTPWNYVS